MILTERLILRPFVETDYLDVFEYQKEPLVNCFACMKLNTLEEAKTETMKKVDDSEFTFAIVLKESGKGIVLNKIANKSRVLIQIQHKRRRIIDF